MRSFTSSRCGLVYVPTDRPDASSSADVIRATDVLPFVPVRWISGYDSCGEPSNRTSASMRSSVGAARRSVPGGSPVDSRLTWASSQDRAARISNSGRVLGELDLDRELLGLQELQRPLDAAGLAHVLQRGLERVQPLRRVPHDRELDLGAQRLLLRGLRLADLTEHVGRNLVDGAVRLGSLGGRPELLRVGPRRPVDRALLPPRPHLLGDEGEVRGEETQQGGQGELERLACRACAALAGCAVRALLHELEVIVAEVPEEPLGRVEGAFVVVALERARRVDDEAAQLVQQGPVEGLGDLAGRLAPDHTERELRRVEDLDRQAAADLELTLVDSGVDARSPA